jgi:hypothetical protein
MCGNGRSYNTGRSESVSSPPKLADLGWLGSGDPEQLQGPQKLQL